jgi:ribose transport system ATP-binding protein
MVPGLAIKALSKTFAGQRALVDVDFDVRSGEVHVLLGQNGSGKSTMIKILSGYHAPDPGAEISVCGTRLMASHPMQAYRAGARFVHQDLGLARKASVLDNLALSGGYRTRMWTISKRAAMEEAVGALKRVGLDGVSPLTEVGSLTAASQTEVAIARALREDADYPAGLLVLDEPTAALPLEEVDHLLGSIRAIADGGVAVLLVTHHLEEAMRIADRVSVLRDGSLVCTLARQQITREVLVDHLLGKREDLSDRKGLPSASRSGAFLKIRDLQAGPLRGVDLDLHPGRIVGLAGITGSGRESFLGAVFGAISRQEGTVLLDGLEIPPAKPAHAVRAGMGYLPPDRKALACFVSMTARENLTVVSLDNCWSGRWLSYRRERAESLAWFKDIDVRPATAIDNPLSTFSGGNQQKILLARWLRRSLKVFLLDEPTQGVDIGAKASVHLLLKDASLQGMVVGVSSNDIEELVALCDEVIVFRDGHIVGHLSDKNITEARISSLMLGIAEGAEGS